MFILRRQSVPFFSRKSPVIPLLSDKVGKDRDTGERVKMLSDGKGQNRGCCGGRDEVFGGVRVHEDFHRSPRGFMEVEDREEQVNVSLLINIYEKEEMKDRKWKGTTYDGNILV